MEFLSWFFSLDMDAVTLPWLENNKYTVGFVLALPYLVYRWWRHNMSRIQALPGTDTVDAEYYDLTGDEEGNA